MTEFVSQSPLPTGPSPNAVGKKDWSPLENTVVCQHHHMKPNLLLSICITVYMYQRIKIPESFCKPNTDFGICETTAV